MTLTIESVRSRAQFNEFITLPRKLYSGMTGYVAPLDLERRELLDPNTSSFFRHGQAAYWIARREGKMVGRISAQIDELAGPAAPPDLGLFGCLDAIDDKDVVSVLLRTAEDWLRQRNCRHIRGPFQLSINGESGLLIEGQLEKPITLLPWHPAYLDRHVRNSDYVLAMKLLSHVLDLSQMALEGTQRLANSARNDLAIRNMNLHNFEIEMEIARSIYNDGWRNNWGFTPAAQSDSQGLAHTFKKFLLPDGGFFIEIANEPGAFALSIPNIFDISADLGAAPNILGWMKLLFRIRRKRYRSFRLAFIGANEKYHGKGVGKIALAEAIRRAHANGAQEIVCAWVLENNLALSHLLKLFGFQVKASYGVYQKNLRN